jgi:hypothetical protein
MNKDRKILNKNIYFRLIALWVLCEAMLGGIIHGFKLPVSGLFVGGAAVVIVCLIAHYVSGKGNILKATIIVAVFKMILSPQSPPPAYFAVFFQGLVGELLFLNKKAFRISCLLLAIFSLVESAIQRILVLMILYDNEFWKAVNDFISKLTNQKEITNYSYNIAIGYILLHVVAGILIGWFAGILPNKIVQWKSNIAIIDVSLADSIFTEQQKRKKKRIKTSLIIVWILLMAVYLQSVIPIGKPLLSSHVSLNIFIRSVLIVLGWYLLINPLLTKWLKNWLQKKQSVVQNEIQKITLLLPSIKYMTEQSWQLSSRKKKIARFVLFIKILTVNIVYGN